jgi:hypothetical protein
MYRFVVIGYSGDAAQIPVFVITDSGEADHGWSDATGAMANKRNGLS